MICETGQFPFTETCNARRTSRRVSGEMEKQTGEGRSTIEEGQSSRGPVDEKEDEKEKEKERETRRIASRLSREEKVPSLKF